MPEESRNRTADRSTTTVSTPSAVTASWIALSTVGPLAMSTSPETTTVAVPSLRLMDADTFTDLPLLIPSGLMAFLPDCSGPTVARVRSTHMRVGVLGGYVGLL